MWLRKLNHGLIKQAKALVNLIEVNQAAELFLDRLNNVEHHYERIEQANNRYEILVRNIVRRWNERCRHEPFVVHIIHNKDDVPFHFRPYRQEIVLRSAVGILKQIVIVFEPEDASNVMKAKESAYERLYDDIMMRGMQNIFYKKEADPHHYPNHHTKLNF